MNNIKLTVVILFLSVCGNAQSSSEIAKSVALHEAGVENFSAGKPDEALRLYRRANEISQSAETYNNIGVTLGTIGRFEEAIDAFKEGLRLFPQSPNLHRNLGFALVKRGNAANAIACYKKAIEIKPDYAAAYTDLGAVLIDLDRSAEAIAILEKAATLDPTDGITLSNLGWAYVQSRKIDKGRATLERAIRVDPGQTEAHFRLGLTYALTGDREAAIQKYAHLKTRDASRAAQLYDLLNRNGIVAAR